jgi:hypothetical protein
LEVVFCEAFDLNRDLAYASNDLLEEYLEDGVRAGVLAAQLGRLLQQVFILSEKLVLLWACNSRCLYWLLGGGGLELLRSLGVQGVVPRELLPNKSVYVVHNVVNIVVEFLVEAHKLLREIGWHREGASMKEVIEIVLGYL